MVNLSGPQRDGTLICIANGGQWFDGYTVSRSGCLYGNPPGGDR